MQTMDTDTVENFEISPLEDFEVGKPFKTNKYSKHSFTLKSQGDGATPSGVKATTLNGVGQKVLVVGDDSVVRLDFAEAITNLSWVFYLVTDYTEDDLKLEHPELVGSIQLSELTPENFDTFCSITAINGDEAVEYSMSADTGLTSGTLGTRFVTAVEFKTSLAGTIHLDALRWKRAT